MFKCWVADDSETVPVRVFLTQVAPRDMIAQILVIKLPYR